jgi:hypothetical protein
VRVSRSRLAIRKLLADLKKEEAELPAKTPAAVKKFIVTMHEQVAKRFSKWDDAVLLAELLDPAVKDSAMTPEESDRMWCVLDEKVVALNKGAATRGAEDAKTGGADAKGVSPDELAMDDILGPALIEQKLNLQDEVARYRLLSRIDRVLPQLGFWVQRQKEFPTLKRLAFRYLVMMFSSAPVERTFSAGGNTVTKKRSRLKASTVENIVLIHDNSDLFASYAIPAKEPEDAVDSESSSEDEAEAA